MQSKRFWYFLDPYAWIIFVMSLITAIVIGEAWVILVGIIGYEFVLLIELTRGRTLGRTGAVRLARAEQELREIQAERARLLGALDEQKQKLATAGLLDDGDMVETFPDEKDDEPDQSE
jgi:hypothetical protein